MSHRRMSDRTGARRSNSHYQSSVCDYYIGDTTDSSPPEQSPGRGDPLHERWARNFDVAGSSDTFAVGYPR